MDYRLISDVVQAVGALGAMAAAGFSFVSVGQSKRAQQSTVYLGMAARYDAQDMRDSCNELLAWRRLHGDAFSEVWSAQMVHRDDAAIRVNTARRIVARHFLNIAKLRKINAIDREAARLLADCYGLNVFYQIVVPLNRRIATDVDDFEALTRRLRNIRKTYASGELIASF